MGFVLVMNDIIASCFLINGKTHEMTLLEKTHFAVVVA